MMRLFFPFFLAAHALLGASLPDQAAKTSVQLGRPGGRLVDALRAEPRTLNPIAALDAQSRELIRLLHSDLITIDRSTMHPAAALAKSWTVSADKRRYTLKLREGARFSDGQPVTAEDVLFTFQVHLDEKSNSAQREFLTIGGKPVLVRKQDTNTVTFELAAPYAAAERLFDGIAILPKHKLAGAYDANRIASEWTLTADPTAVAGTGPFRFKSYVPGQRIVLERNPFYWKRDSAGQKLPYLDEIVFVFAGNENGQLLRLESGEASLVEGLSPDSFEGLKAKTEQRGLQLLDAGAGLDYTLALFNLNAPNGGSVRVRESARLSQKWFQDVRFRQAVSSALDREGVKQLVYHGLASPLATHVTPGRKEWVNPAASKTAQSLEHARELLRQAGFTWNATGQLLDSSGREVAFSLLTSAGNAQRGQIATIVQDDLKPLGMKVSIVSLEFRAMVDRVFKTYDYEAAVMTLSSGDTDPNADMNFLTAEGNARIWNMDPGAQEQAWEQELDRLMRAQSSATSDAERRKIYFRVQELVAQNLPVVPLVSPHILIAASSEIGNLLPSSVRPYTLWNADELYIRARQLHRP